jgi:polar amino acid transport system substrate-binding protein
LALLAAVLSGCGEAKPGIEKVEDAKHARIGVMTGSTGEVYAKKNFPDADIKSFDDIMDAVAAVKSGQIDGIVTALSTAIQVCKTNKEFAYLEERLTNENTAIAIRKGEGRLLADLNRIISDLRNEGAFENMKRRWFKDDLSPYDEPDIKLPETGKPLRIGVAATREPFSFVDKDGRVTGHDGELARLIGQRLNRPIEFHNMKFMALIPALASGKIDMIVTGMTATDERRKSVDFTQSYFANAQVLLTRKSATAAVGTGGGGLELRTQADLADKRIGVMVGTVYDEYALEKWPKADVQHYQASTDLVLALDAGKVDAILYDAEPLREVLREQTALVRFGPPLFTLPMGVGFRKGNPLRGEFNRFLTEIRSNGVYDDMTTRWIDHREYAMPEIKVDHPSGTLVVGATGGSMPFSGVQDGRMIGFDIELAQRFAAFLGKELEISDMEFGGLIAAAAAGKVDLIAASIYITDERSREIDFSNPYFDMESWAVIRKVDLAGENATAEPERSFLERVGDSFHANIIHEKRYLLLWDGLKVTVLISILATLFGTALGGVICFMRMSRSALLSVPAKIYISLLRGIPVLVLLMLIFYVVFASVNISPIIVAVIAFGMNFAAYVAEIYRSGIESVDRGQSEAGVAMGFTRVQAFTFIVMPQTIRRILPVYKGEVISMVKMTSIVGYIAVQDLTKASDIIRSRTFDAFFPLIMVAILYFLISWLLIQSLGYLERKTDPKYTRRKAGAA